VVLWETLTGRRAEETHEPALGDARELNPEVPPLLGQIVERAMAPAREHRYQTADELAAALAGFVPEGADPRLELANLLALCFNVPLHRRLVAEDVAEARRFLRAHGTAAATSVTPAPSARTTVALIPPAIARRARSAGPWIAATVAAIVATSGIGLLHTHGRTARSRASAEPLAAPAPAPRALAASVPARAPEPTPPALAPELVPPPLALEVPPSPPSVAVHGAPPVGARRVEGRTPEPVERAPRDAAADRLLHEANGLWERGNTPGAYALAREAQAAGAGAPAHVLLGALLINMKNFVAAEPELATAVRLDPRNAEARRLLALLHRTGTERQAR
jgi:hypothetical protein